MKKIPMQKIKLFCASVALSAVFPSLAQADFYGPQSLCSNESGFLYARGVYDEKTYPSDNNKCQHIKSITVITKVFDKAVHEDYKSKRSFKETSSLTWNEHIVKIFDKRDVQDFTIKYLIDLSMLEAKKIEIKEYYPVPYDVYDRLFHLDVVLNLLLDENKEKDEVLATIIIRPIPCRLCIRSPDLNVDFGNYDPVIFSFRYRGREDFLKKYAESLKSQSKLLKKFF